MSQEIQPSAFLEGIAVMFALFCRSRFRLTIGAATCCAATLAISVPALAETAACVPHSALSLVDRGTASTTPCVVGKHGAMVELGYFQNASQYGGTALAEYPLAHIRYGLTDRLELFVDPATAIAKSGLNGAGIYTWSRSGGGARYLLHQTETNTLSADLDYTPQADETAALETRERYQYGLRDRFVLSPRINVGVAAGNTTFTQENRSGNQQSSLYARFTVTDRLGSRVSANAFFGRDSHVMRDSVPQSKVGIGLQDALSHNAVGDVELGSAINAAGTTKAHYLGFGVSFLK